MWCTLKSFMKEIARLYPDHVSRLEDIWTKALERADLDAALIYAGSPHTIFRDDQDYPFQVNAYFKQWAPVTENPHCFLFFKPGDRPRMLFWQPVDFWHKPADKPDSFWVDAFDLRLIRSVDDARDELPRNVSRCALIGEADPRFHDWGLGPRNPDRLLAFLDYHRAWKSAYELACLRAANRLGVAAHLAAEAAFRNGASEFDIHMAYLKACEHNEHQLPYSNIIALNEHAAVLHYQHQARQAPDRSLSFLIDAGAEFNGYASDITRTHANDGEFKRLIGAVDAAQQTLCAQVQPGLDYRDLQSAAHVAVAGILHEFELIKVDVEEAVESGLTRSFFPHGVGHYLGLQVHDAGGFMADESGKVIDKPDDQPALRLTRRVEPGQVFTVEPGVYFIESLLSDLAESALGESVAWDRVNALRPYGGVRIEDNVIVTEAGHENMTRNAFAAA